MRLGTRGSQLALWQANTVARLLLERTGTHCEIVTIRTSGDDRSATESVSTAPPDMTKRVFVKELEDALLDRRIDLAVHSAKDMSAAQPAGLAIGATLPREDPRDALVLPAGRPIALDIRDALSGSPRMATSSIRRTAQLMQVFPGATFAPIRGNVDTRLKKLDGGAADALVLAVAGLRRLGLEARISYAIPTDLCTPAPGQGIVAVQLRAGDDTVKRAVSAIDDRDASDALAAEHALVRALGAGCQLPVGALARVDDEELIIDGVVIAPDGSRAIRDLRHGSRHDATTIGEALAHALLSAGAGEILEQYGGPRL